MSGIFHSDALGPLAPLLADPAVTEVMLDGPGRISVERNGKLEDIGPGFANDAQALRAIEALLAPLGMHLSEEHPILDARLADGSRMHVVGRPIAVDGPSLVIRKFSQRILTFDDLVGWGSLSADMVTFLRACVKGWRNIAVSGGTGSGKTSVLNTLATEIPAEERIITISYGEELKLPQKRVVRLETRAPNSRGTGEITARDLVLSAIKMRPERLVVAESSRDDLFELVLAMNNGHNGSMTSIHATSPRDALGRMEMMAALYDPGIPLLHVREQIASAFNLILQHTRLPDGSRRMTHITEVLGMERETIMLQDLFLFEEQGQGEDGRIVGSFRATGYKPTFLQELRQRGIDLPDTLFG
jgi:pilus assembly protein CpaF